MNLFQRKRKITVGMRYGTATAKKEEKIESCREEHITIKSNENDYNKFVKELNDNEVYHKAINYNYSSDDIDFLCDRKTDQSKIINEFPCISLRSKGVYFYGDNEPFYKYQINTESKLRLDESTGYLTLDDQNILALEQENLALPTKIRCN